MLGQRVPFTTMLGVIAVHAFIVASALRSRSHLHASMSNEPRVDTTVIWVDPGPVVLPRGAAGSDVVIESEKDQPKIAVPDDAVPVFDSLLRPITATSVRWVAAFVADSGRRAGGPEHAALYNAEPPEIIAAGRPAYPEVMRQAGLAGVVRVQAVVNTNGRAERASIVVVASPHAAFDRPAIEYVLGALFRPAHVNGQPVRVLVEVPVEFRLRR